LASGAAASDASFGCLVPTAPAHSVGRRVPHPAADLTSLATDVGRVTDHRHDVENCRTQNSYTLGRFAESVSADYVSVFGSPHAHDLARVGGFQHVCRAPDCSLLRSLSTTRVAVSPNDAKSYTCAMSRPVQPAEQAHRNADTRCGFGGCRHCLCDSVVIASPRPRWLRPSR